MNLNANRILASDLPQIFSCEKCGNEYYAGFGDYSLICFPNIFRLREQRKLSIIFGTPVEIKAKECYAVSKCDQCGNEIFREIPNVEYDSLISKMEEKQ